MARKRKVPASGFEKGESGNASGRPKGAKNKVSSKNLRAMLLRALEDVGGTQWLTDRLLDPKTQGHMIGLFGKGFLNDLKDNTGQPLKIVIVEKK